MQPDITAYNQNAADDTLRVVCNLLAERFSEVLVGAMSKVWHGSPVWFVDGNPIVGYYVSKKGMVVVLFWSGQSFTTPGLAPEGSFKAAQIAYKSTDAINDAALDAWLEESLQIMWNYRDIRKNRGLVALKGV